MDIKLSFSSNILTDIRILAYETTSPGTPVASDDFSAPYLPSIQAILTVPNDTTHIVRIYELISGSLGGLLNEFHYDPTYSNVSIPEPYEIVVDGGGTYDPASGGVQINIAPMSGQSAVWVERRGVGNLRKNVEYIDIPGGGIELISPDQLHPNETFFIQPPVTVTASIPPISTFSRIFSDTTLIDADTTLESSHLRKLLLCVSASNTLTITLDLLSSIPENTHIGFVAPCGLQKQVKIVTGGTDKISYCDGFTDERNEIHLGVNESVVLWKNGSFWYVLFPSGNFDKVGQRIYSDKLLPNTLLEDGSEYNLDEYPRVNYHLNQLPSTQVVDYTTWNATQSVNGETVYPNKGLWAIDLVNNKFKVPDTRNNFRRALKGGTDGERIGNNVPGAYQHHEFKQHKHTITDMAGNSYTGSPNSSRRGNGGANPQTYTPDTGNAGGAETRSQNNGYNSLICI